MRREPGDLLERATPVDVMPVDYHELARRGRRRRQVKRIGGSVAVLVLVAAAAVTAMSLRSTPTLEVAQEPTSDPAQDGRARDDVPAGTWSQSATLGEGRNGAFAATTQDGRLVIYGGTTDIEGAPAAGGIVLDPATGDSTDIPAAPIADRPLPWTAFAGDRLLVFGGNAGQTTGAFYDVSDGTWTEVPAAPNADVAPNVRVWDGTTLIVGDAYRMQETAYGNVELWRWDVGDPAWEQVPDAELDPGQPAFAFAEGRLAVWVSPIPEPDRNEDGPTVDAPGVAADAAAGSTRLAVLDLTANEWTHIDRGTLPDTGGAAVAWLDGDLVVIPHPPQGAVMEVSGDGEPADFADPVRFDLAAGTSEQLAPMPEALRRTNVMVTVGSEPPAIDGRATVVATVAQQTAALLPDGTWTEPVQANHIRRVGGTLVAVHSPWRADTPLTAHVWASTGWKPAADPGLPTRGFAATAASDRALYLIGGTSMRSPRPGEEPDASPSEDGEGGPWVFDIHEDVIAYDPVVAGTAP